MKPIYLDYAATTPVDPRVAAKMSEFLTQAGAFGNPSSTHYFGQKAKEAVESARVEVADLIGADSSEIIWTSGATESTNLAIKGAALLYQNKGRHIITLKTEHPATLDCCQQLEKEGFSVTYLTPEKNGLLNLSDLEAAFRPDTMLVSIMHVNNELGVIQDIQKIAEATSNRGILLHVDAAQSAGKVKIDLKKMPVDLMSFAAHKIYGPKGAGALYVRKKPRIRLGAQIHGGGQEQGMRSGTLATHQIVGMGEAFLIAKQEFEKDYMHISNLRNYFLDQLKNNPIFINTDLQNSVPNILNIRFDGIKSSELMKKLPALAISSGSACHAKESGGSYVLRALGQNEMEAQCAVRFSFGRFTTIDEIECAAKQISLLMVFS